MRDLKFRAWDSKGKRFFEAVALEFRLNTSFAAVFPPEVVFMQFTGLLDKNGKEIYDQDYFVTDGARAQIHYSVNHACWFWGSERFSSAIARRGEVIGNIYENPELLEGKK